jgi:predicted NBD/HSP70 family sugar kinase
MILAIDVGGTKTLVASFTMDGKATEHIKFPTPKDYPAFIAELANTIANLTTKKFVRGVIAMPGKIDRQNGVAIAFGNLPWHDIPIVADIQKIINIPIMVENDANLAGLSEAHMLKQYRKVLYLTVSTGIGGVYIIDGKIDPDTQDAEYGHMLFEHEGILQRWEHFASGSAIMAKFGKRASDITDVGDWYKISHNIAIGLIDVIAAITPEVVVIGGGVGTHFDKFGDRLYEDLKIYQNDLITVPPLFGAQRAEDAVIYGCYLLAMQKS